MGPCQAVLFLPEHQLTAADLSRVIAALIAAGFATSPPGDLNLPGQYSAGGGVHSWTSIEEPLAAFEDPSTWDDIAAAWSVVFWKERLGAQTRTPSLRVDRYTWPRDQIPREPFFRVTFDTLMSEVRRDPTLATEFLSWATFLAELTGPWYGWAGGEVGLFHAETDPLPTRASVAAAELHCVQWLNIFGPSYVERLGRDRLLATPAWRVEFLVNGSIAVTLAPDLDTISHSMALQASNHLGLPLSPHFYWHPVYNPSGLASEFPPDLLD
jgi:hypothetical protein